jgi:hypothetical protein
MYDSDDFQDQDLDKHTNLHINLRRYEHNNLRFGSYIYPDDAILGCIVASPGRSPFSQDRKLNFGPLQPNIIGSI